MKERFPLQTYLYLLTVFGVLKRISIPAIDRLGIWGNADCGSTIRSKEKHMNLTSDTTKRNYNDTRTHRSTGLTLILFLFIAFVLLLNNSMAKAQKIYWMDAGTGKIQRADLDGRNVEEVITGVSSPTGMAIDGDRQKIYWTEPGRIQRAELDGSHVKTVRIIPTINIYDIAVDAPRGKIYWTMVQSGKVQRANLDGSSLEDFANTITPYSIAIGEYDVYWTSPGMGKIQRKDVGGGLIIDAVNGEGIVTHGLAVDSIGGKVYWTDEASHKIQRANLDGTQIEDIVTTGLQQPRDIIVNGGLEKIYWADFGTGKIQRANLDGSHVEDIIIGLSAPVDIVMDIPPAPSISFSTPLIDFGDVIANEPILITFSIGNKGSMPLIVSGITSTLGNVLAISDTNFTVAPREEQHVTLTLNPSSIGVITGTLTVTGNAVNAPKEISITGNVRGAQIDAGTDIIDFGTVRAGKSKIIPVGIRNTGNADLNVTSITSTLGGVLDISGFPFTVAPGLAHFVTLVLTPTNVGSITGTLTIFSNALLSTFQVPITVNAIDPQPIFNLTIPSGLSLIHLPVSTATVNDQPMALKTISNLYDILTPDN
ncbi:choice-of-anchor D domain-containing protein, partial [Candidatus Poribacteria bacterium]|nr:choice-of-anchor D domain-containing protein [Candidatus Poribacteria bacterium]